MTTAQSVSVEAQGLYKFFNPGHPTKVDLDLRWVHHALILTLRDGSNIELSGFTEPDAKKLHAAVSAGLRRDREAEAKEHEERLRIQARSIASDIRALNADLLSLVPKSQFVRKSQATTVAPRIQALTSRCKPELVAKLDPETSNMLADIVAAESVVMDDTRRDETNQWFVQAQAKPAQSAAVTLGYRTLTQEQAAAVATDEDITLVAAGAGTGKTTVITGKRAHLVANQKVDPKHVLVLAFNT